MQVYPAIDIRGGTCVNLVQGDFGRETVYHEDPREAARIFLAQGADWLHVVDLDAARSAERTHAALVREIIQLAAGVPVQVGGGLRTLDDVRAALDDGAARAVLGTAAVRDPDLLRRAAAAFPGAVAVGVDARGGRVVVDAWETDGTLSPLELSERAVDAGAAALVHTDVARDGMLGQPNFAATEDLVRRYGARVDVIASGGVHSADDVRRLAALGADGVIIGRALYTGAVTLAEAIAAARG